MRSSADWISLLPMFLLAGSIEAAGGGAALGCRREPPTGAGPIDAAPPQASPDTATVWSDSGFDSSVAADVAGSSVAADVAGSSVAADVAGDGGQSPEPAALPMRKEDWEVAIGKWSFENGEATCECKATSSLLYWKHARPKDFDASVEVWFLTVESSVGILFRERGEDFYEDATFYQYEWYTRGTHHDKRLSLMIKNPYWVQIVTPKEPEAPLGKWIRLRVRAEGDHLRTWIDDDLVFDKVDKTFVRTGRIGLHVFQPRKIRLRDFRLTVLGE